jgi:hypothetical protein
MSIVKDLSKLAAEKIMYAIETPRDVRKQQRRSKRTQREPWQTKYFGLLALSLQVWRTKKAHKRDDIPRA